MFSYSFYKTLNSTFFTEQLRTTASGNPSIQYESFVERFSLREKATNPLISKAGLTVANYIWKEEKMKSNQEKMKGYPTL